MTTPEISQADREAAADYLFAFTHGDIESTQQWHDVKNRRDDGHRLVQAFALHRTQARDAALEEQNRDHTRLIAALVHASGGRIEVDLVTAVDIPRLELRTYHNPVTDAVIYETRLNTSTTTGEG